MLRQRQGKRKTCHLLFLLLQCLQISPVMKHSGTTYDLSPHGKESATERGHGKITHRPAKKELSSG